MANAIPDVVSPTPAPPERSRRDYWAALIEECSRSGLRQAEFCRQRGIKRRSLSFWKWKLSHPAGAARAGTSRRGRPPRPRAFVPVQVITKPGRRAGALSSPTIAGEGELEIVLEPGRLVRVRGRVDAEWLRQVLVTVEATRC
jgi:hypothetical protein